jgi:hypothetical protein
MMGVGQTGPD